MLVVEGLRAGYDSKEVVHGISFTVDDGEFCCIIGPNGCGKTTALKSVLGLLKPMAGTVEMDGKDTVAMDDATRARQAELRDDFDREIDRMSRRRAYR